jgi:ATP-dependent DNA helicase DinG
VGHILTSEDRLTAMNIPTGVGKTLVYMAGAVLLGGRVVVLTSTKALQHQLMVEFSSIGAVEIRGRGSYPCRREPSRTADDGMCRYGVSCQYKERGCYYQDALDRARSSNLVVTNYAFWLAAGARLGKFDTVVMDEGHAGPEWLCSHLSSTMDLRMLSRLTGDLLVFPSIDDLPWWACRLQASLDDQTKQIIKDGVNFDSRQLLRSISKARRRLETLGLVALDGSNLVVDSPQPDLYQVDPIGVSRYADSLLFLHSPRVVTMSSTLTPKTLALIGHGSTPVKQFSSPFPVNRRPVYILDTVGISHKSTQADLDMWAALIKQVVGSRSDRKGIVHTVSYDRTKRVVDTLDPRGVITHDRNGLQKAVAQFRSSSPPAVLVSPSLSTGYDFPGDECRYQVIGKVAFPDNRSPIAQARAKKDPQLYLYLAIQDLIQTCGRGVRTMSDYCENIIIDSHAEWLLHRGSKFVPQWFQSAVSVRSTLPKPLRRSSNE